MSNDYFNFSSPLGMGLARSSQLNGFFESLEDAFDMLPAPDSLAMGTVGFGTTTGSGSAYVLDLTPPIAELVEGLKVQFVANHTSTGATTLNVDGHGATQVRDQNNDPLIAGSIEEDSIHEARYTGGVFRITLPSNLVSASRTLTGGDGIDAIGDLSEDRTVNVDSTVVRTSGAFVMKGALTVPTLTIDPASGVPTLTMDGGGVTSSVNFDIANPFDAGTQTYRFGRGSPAGVNTVAVYDPGTTTVRVTLSSEGTGSVTTGVVTASGYVRAGPTVATQGFRTGTSTNETVVASQGIFAREGGTVFLRPNGASSSSNQASLSTAGTLTVVALTESSDERLKENVEPLAGALASVLQLQGVTYDRIGSNHREVGLQAQDVERVLPQMVHTDGDGMKSIAYSKGFAVLIEAVKEQQATITALQAAVAALQAGGR